MSDYNFDISGLIVLPIIAILALWGCWELIDWLFIEEVIKSNTQIVPELELVVKDNVIDTVYIYREP